MLKTREMFLRVAFAARQRGALLLMLAQLAGGLMQVGVVRAADSFPPVKTVFLILEENTDWSALTLDNAPYIHKTLLPMGAHARQYYHPANLRPSLPNYIWLEAGSNLAIRDNHDPLTNHRDTPDHLVNYLRQAGISWKVYAEDIDGKTCPLTAVDQYAPKHNPVIYFDDVTDGNDFNSAYCIAHVRPYSELATDLRNNTVARYNFIVPNLCNGMHDCGITAGDSWLAREVPSILGSRAYQEGGALFITWDESSPGSEGPIGMIVVSPYAKVNYSNTIRYTHSSMLRTMQEIFGVGPLLRDAANATSLRDLFSMDTTVATAINEGGVVNNAAYTRASAAVAPGSLVAVFGRNFTDGATCLPPACGPTLTADRRIANVMASTQVLVNGTPAPLLYTSPTQLGIQLPVDLSGSMAALQVLSAGQLSIARAVRIAPVAPGIFTHTADGKGAGIITHADGSLVTTENPALPDELLILYGTGFGRVAPAISTGAVAADRAEVSAPVLVMVDQLPVFPEYAGLAGCCVGLNQINFRLPKATHSGTNIPLQLVVGGVTSNIVTMPVR